MNAMTRSLNKGKTVTPLWPDNASRLRYTERANKEYTRLGASFKKAAFINVIIANMKKSAATWRAANEIERVRAEAAWRDMLEDIV